MVVVHEFGEDGAVASAGCTAGGRRIGCWLIFQPDHDAHVLSVYSGLGVLVAQMLVDPDSYHPRGPRVDVIVPGEEAVWRIRNAGYLGLSCERYKDGRSSGLFVDFWPGGAVHMAGTMEDDMRVGCWRYYGQDGSLFLEGMMAADKPTGTWRVYWEDGEFKEYPAEVVSRIYKL